MAERKIVISLYGTGFSATLDGEPGVSGTGTSQVNALGNLVMTYPAELGVEVVDKTTVASE